MKYFYYKLPLITFLLFGISSANANPTLKQCMDQCHKKALNMKDFDSCKKECIDRVKKRPHKKHYRKNYTNKPVVVTPAVETPTVETVVRAPTPQQATLAAAAATGAAAGVLSATTPPAVAPENPVEQPANQLTPETSSENQPTLEQVVPESQEENTEEIPIE